MKKKQNLCLIKNIKKKCAEAEAKAVCEYFGSKLMWQKRVK
ncbi:MAG: hypothetical protein V8S33_14080 [Intestinibacter bartlettii]